jgi:ribonuclease J
MKSSDLKIIPLGGLGEVGRNMTLFEWQGKILIVDAGLSFPEENTPGIDYIIPNTNYLQKRKKDILGLVFTHGHYDHIGAVPYILDRIGNPRMFASDITREIIIHRESEFPHKSVPNITVVKDGSHITLDPFKISFFHQNHNIPGNLGLVIETPVGKIVHTSDFKFDLSPVNSPATDFKKIEAIGHQGILLLMADSTDAEKEGHSLSEKVISENLEKIILEAKNKVIVATFASLINRIQQIISSSEKAGRKVVIRGRSIQKNVEIAQALGYIKAKGHTIIPPEKAKNYKSSQLTILCTGTQAEERSALIRIASGDDRFIKANPGDRIIFSSSVIPGNERAVQLLKDQFYFKGLDVVHYNMMDIHAGGHAQQEELKKMIRLIKPKFFMPIHGYHSMLMSHKNLASEEGVNEKNVIIAENGQVIELNNRCFKTGKEKVPANYILVDGLGVGDIGEVVLRDRKNLSQDGMFVIVIAINHKTGALQNSPDIVSRGFIYLRRSQKLLGETRKEVTKILQQSLGKKDFLDVEYIKDRIREQIGEFLFRQTKRRPIIIPVVIKL